MSDRLRCGPRNIVGIVGCAGVLLCVASMAGAQVTPEFSVATRGVFSASYEDRGAADHSAVSDFSDTALLLGLQQKLYSSWRSRFVVGMQFPDADSELGQIFYHQVFVQVEDLRNVLKFGRSRLRGSLVEFPTLRDDDALAFTEVLNPFATGRNTEDSQFGNVLEYSRILAQRVWVTAHGEHYAESAFVDPATQEEFRLNSIGGSVEYRVPETQLWNRNVVQRLGLSVNTLFLDQEHLGPGREESVTSAIAGFVLNLHPDPVNLVDLRLQSVYNTGLGGMKTLTEAVDLARARSTSVFLSLRYLKRTLERPAYQVAVAGGFKNYPDLSVDSSQWQVLGNVAWRIGEGFDLVGQALYEERKGDVAKLLGDQEFQLQVGFVYGFQRVFNSQFSDRESLLNLEHGYIP